MVLVGRASVAGVSILIRRTSWNSFSRPVRRMPGGTARAALSGDLLHLPPSLGDQRGAGNRESSRYNRSAAVTFDFQSAPKLPEPLAHSPDSDSGHAP